jgi:thioredoxin-related protein
MGPKGDMPIFLQSILSETDEKQKNNKTYTFGDLNDLLKDFKKKEDYLKVRNIVIAKNELQSKKAVILNWETDSLLLIQMGFSYNQINDIYSIIKCNEGKQYSEIFKFLADSWDNHTDSNIVDANKISDKKEENISETIEWIRGLTAYNNHETGLKKSKEINKPALIYFTGYACVNSRRFEDGILTIPEIRDYISQHLVFIVLIVDEKNILKEEEIYFSDLLNKEIRYTGQRNMEIQIRQYQSKTQPLFVLISPTGRVISRIEFSNDEEEFLSFLKQIEKND